MDAPVSRIGWNDEKIRETRRELETVKTIMKQNVNKMMEREGRLDELVERAQKLESSAGVYVKCAVKVHRKMHWKARATRLAIISLSCASAVAGLAYTFL